ncbi:MAG: hypothetical protein DSY42_01055 [Aquifex sp.]|nr:MAG: hypothetical protein DSY42_01055 [Aquifex sp.]
MVEPLFMIKILFTLLMLVYTSILDIKTREVEPRLWLYFFVPLFIIMVYQVMKGVIGLDEIKFQLLILALLATMLGALYYTGMLGGGDVFAFLVIGVSHPETGGILFKHPPFPLVLQTILFASVFSGFLSLYFCIYNIALNRDKLKELAVKERMLYCFTAIALPIEKVIKRRFWYPLERPWEGRLLRYFKVEEDDVALIEKLEKWAIENNAMGRKVWVTYGSPFILYILIGYGLSILGVGNYILKTIIGLAIV